MLFTLPSTLRKIIIEFNHFTIGSFITKLRLLVLFQFYTSASSATVASCSFYSILPKCQTAYNADQNLLLHLLEKTNYKRDINKINDRRTLLDDLCDEIMFFKHLSILYHQHVDF